MMLPLSFSSSCKLPSLPNAFQTRQQHQTQSSMAFSSRLLIEDYDGRSDPMLTNQIGPDYFKTIFKDVSNRSVTPRTENMPSNFVDNVAFFEYTKLPGIICDRFFSMFSKQQPGNFVVESEFVRGFLQVYLSSLEKKIELTFKMYDFTNKDKITKEDVRILMSYVPFKQIQAKSPINSTN